MPDDNGFQGVRIDKGSLDGRAGRWADDYRDFFGDQPVPSGGRPAQVPDWRNWISDALAPCGGLHAFFMDGAKSGEVKPIIAEQTAIMRLESQHAEMYWIVSDMCQLLLEASGSIPLESQFAHESVVTPRGLAFFANPLKIHDTPVCAALWFPHKAGDNRGTTVMWLGRTPHPQAPFVWVGQTGWSFNTRLDETQDRDDSGRRLFLTLMALLSSPGVTSLQDQPQERSARRRSQRAGTSLSHIRIIHLRNSRGRASEPTDAESPYYHRWIVSGHWRLQPYGPGRMYRKPIWISPHIKGPEGAPMLTGDKVKVLSHAS